MYSTVPPETGSTSTVTAAAAARVELTGVFSRTFDQPRQYAPDLVRFFGDLATLLGTPGDPAAADRVTFTEMARGMLADLRGDGEPTGLVLLAHSTPDSEPTWPACYLTDNLAGHPLAFSVADQGPVAPFTALRILSSYVRSGEVHRAAVLILDQKTMLARPDADLPMGNRAVALVFGRRRALGRVSTEVTPEVDRSEVSRVLAGLATDAGQTVVVAGAGLGSAVAPGTVVAAPGLPCTGPWHRLAVGLPQWRSTARRIVVVDHDDALGCLGVCSLELYPTVTAQR